jgi:hypothetical protein
MYGSSSGAAAARGQGEDTSAPVDFVVGSETYVDPLTQSFLVNTTAYNDLFATTDEMTRTSGFTSTEVVPRPSTSSAPFGRSRYDHYNDSEGFSN